MVVKKPEPQEDTWVNEPKEQVAPVIVQNGDGKITVTLKAGPGFEVPWIVRHANTVAEAVEFMQDEQLDELMDLTARKAKEFAKAFGGSQSFSKPASSGGWGNKAQAAPAASQGSSERPSGTCPTHNCDLTYVEPFTKRDGTTISARVACPVPKCYAKTFWQNKDGSWTEK